MKQPDIKQKTAILDYLDKCEPDEWVAITHWMRDQLLADDQAMLATILFRESARRNEQINKYKESDARVSPEVTFQTVLRDLGLRLTV